MPGALASTPAAVACALVLVVWLPVQLCERTVARHLGAALTVILVAALASNLNLIPSGAGTESSIVYSAVFAWVAPLSIFWLLLPINLLAVLKAGAPMLIAFALGAVGTTLGVVVGMQLIGGAELLGPNYAPLAGM